MLKWNKHPSKWLACYLKWIILVISKLLVTTDGRRFCNIKETDNSHSRWQSFQFRFNSSAEIVCNQLNFNRNFFVFSRIFCLRNNSVNPNINRSFFQPSVIFFQIADWGLVLAAWNIPVPVARSLSGVSIAILSVICLSLTFMHPILRVSNSVNISAPRCSIGIWRPWHKNYDSYLTPRTLTVCRMQVGYQKIAIFD